MVLEADLVQAGDRATSRLRARQRQAAFHVAHRRQRTGVGGILQLGLRDEHLAEVDRESDHANHCDDGHRDHHGDHAALPALRQAPGATGMGLRFHGIRPDQRLPLPPTPIVNAFCGDCGSRNDAR